MHAMGRDGGLSAQMIPPVRAIQECADAVKRLASFFLFLQTNFWIPNEFLESNGCVPTVNTTTTTASLLLFVVRSISDMLIKGGPRHRFLVGHLYSSEAPVFWVQAVHNLCEDQIGAAGVTILDSKY